jgi:hypothetical protein
MSVPASNDRPYALGRVTRVSMIVLTTIALISCLVCGAWWLARYKSGRKRSQWKGPALERLARLSITNEEVRQELEALKASNTNDTQLGWAHDHVMLMTNGEYIIYEYLHGANIYFPPHLFLAHGSDGRWLYSSYHFCNSMMMARFDDPPESIAKFAKRYSVREFDGKSDVCLKTTE